MLTCHNAAFSSLHMPNGEETSNRHLNPGGVVDPNPPINMNAISLEYTDLSSAALIKIFQLADLLGVTPKDAAKIYLAAQAKKVTQTAA